MQQPEEGARYHCPPPLATALVPILKQHTKNMIVWIIFGSKLLSSFLMSAINLLFCLVSTLQADTGKQ